MKTRAKHRVLAGALALFMSVTAVSFSPVSAETAGGGAAASGDKTYVLDAATLTTVPKKSTEDPAQSMEAIYGSLNPISAGTENYFKINVDKDTRFDASSKNFTDGFVGSKRINFNGGTNTGSFVNSIEFTANNPATVKVWWTSGDTGRYVVLYNQSGTAVAQSAAATDKNTTTMIATLDIPAAGKYFIGNQAKTNYIFKIEVTEHLPKTYTLNAADLKTVPKKSTEDPTQSMEAIYGSLNPISAGTENYFKINVDKDTRFDASSKNFTDGFVGSKRINFNGGTNTGSFVNSIEFTANNPATVKVWWTSGDTGRYVVLYNQSGTAVAQSAAATDKNTTTMIATLDIPAAGKYFIGNQAKTNYLFKIEVTVGGGKIVRGDWADVAAPSITSAAQNGSNIDVVVSADVSNDGGDAVEVIMYDKDGNAVGSSQRSSAAKTSHTLTFTPPASGNYTFKAVLSREEETDKVSAMSSAVAYVLPLGKTTISRATNKGSGSIEIVWDAVKEATGYEIYRDDTKVGTTTTATTYTDTGLTVGDTHSYTVKAVRDAEVGAASDPKTATVTAEEQRIWATTTYGASVDQAHNGVVGDINANGQITVYSEGGKGKIQGGDEDGITFHYTPVPNANNFTFRAKMHVDGFTYSNGQEAMGLLVSDSVPDVSYTTDAFWTNLYYLTLGTVAYRWDTDTHEITMEDGVGKKYDMRFGLGVYPNLGLTPENMSQLASMKGKIDPNIQYTLETSAVQKNLDAGRYNIAAGSTNPANTPAAVDSENLISDFDIEIQRNNTGYFFTYYDTEGNVIGKQKFYDRDALSVLNGDTIYVGFFASRNARATFTDIQLTLTDPATDPPAEERVIETVNPTFNINSAAVANSPDYTLTVSSNVAGTAEITVRETRETRTVELTPDVKLNQVFTLNPGDTTIDIVFTPDPDQDLGEYKVLGNSNIIRKSITVTFDNYFAALKNLYVSPTGSPVSNGSAQRPLDIYTAVSVAQPGQKIILMEGTYKLESTVRIERGMDGTSAEPIYMIADPNAASRPVLDFRQSCQGVKAGGNYWYFQGFDVTNTINGQGGFYVNGNNITLDQIHAYNNGNTGIQISAFNNSNDPRELWPQNNLILNCVSYNNADAGYEDADGFAAKLTIGEGNVFDGCVSFNNADDGWDLYARGSSGSIGAVTIRNCVAYGNGYLMDGTNAGNGNGFKLGGSNLPGGHKLINSAAFNNKADGITSNSCPDVSVINCTSYNNGKYNLNLYTNNKSQATSFHVEGMVSFKYIAPTRTVQTMPASSYTIADQVKDTDVPESGSVWRTADNFIWNGAKSLNSAGAELTEAMFESLIFEEDGNIGVARNADGTINLNGFLDLDLTSAPAPVKEAIKGAKFGADAATTDPNNPIRTPSASIDVTEEKVSLDVRPQTPNISREPTGSESGSTDTTKPAETTAPSDAERPKDDTNKPDGDKNVNTGVSLAFAPTALAALALAGSIVAKKKKK